MYFIIEAKCVTLQIRWSKCPQLIKNFYSEHPDVTNMTPEHVNLMHLLFGLRLNLRSKWGSKMWRAVHALETEKYILHVQNIFFGFKR